MTPEELAYRCLDTETAEDCNSRMVPSDLGGRIADAVREAVEEERAACLEIAERLDREEGYGAFAGHVATAIRARAKREGGG